MRGTAVVLAQATGDEPAGGAAAAEALGATAGALLATALVAWVIAGHRSGRTGFLSRASRWAERETGLPGWAALPSMVVSASLLIAVLGMYWDISLHIDNGRDAGPLANPAHYLILVGLYGTLAAGALAIALSGRERPCATAVNLGGGWWAPVGGLMIAACGAFALSGFPLDDMWHRIFGQDVTLWGPTHLMLIGGGSLATLGSLVLLAEAVRHLGRDPERQRRAAGVYYVRRALLVGGLLVALSTFQGEFDFGVPQFRLVLHPVLIMLAAGIGLVAARIYLGRGGALLAVLGFLLIRGFLAVAVGGVFGQTTPHFPLYLVEALVVEVVFLRAAGRSPVAMGALAGVFIGTAGLAAEWAWSGVWMPIPWSSALLPEAALAGPVAAVAAGALGGFVGSALTGGVAHRGGGRWFALGGAAVLVAVVAWHAPLSDEGPRNATMALRDAGPGLGGRAVQGHISIAPADSVAGDPEFVNITAWQGGGLVLDPLERTGPGRYRTTEPIPVHGGWKANLRVHRGDALVSVPIYLPEDRAIPAPAVPASARFTRPFQPDIELLQRERKPDVPGALSVAAYLTVLAIVMSLFAFFAWALLRLGRGRTPRRQHHAAGPVPAGESRFSVS
ncbi:MAG TPA: hypothetical protein VHJ37_12010 [Thermoleophilaceae bacterium]|nr:hypothetical protein [Thermoleophilaceae bacterium]